MNHFVYSQTEPVAIMAGWTSSWYVFAAYALVVAVSFMIIFENPQKTEPLKK